MIFKQQKSGKVKNDTARNKKRRRKAIIICCTAVVLVLVDVYSVFGGQIKFYTMWIQCGTKPVEIHVNLGGHIEYHRLSPSFSLYRGNQKPYFCNAKEAELAGYSAVDDRYYFPLLTDRERN